MANTVYDPGQKRNRNSGSPDLGPGHNRAAGDPSDPRSTNTTGTTSSTGGRSVYNAPTVPKSDLRTAEESPNNPGKSGSDKSKGSGGFYNPGGDQAGKSQGGSTNSTKSSSPSSLKDAESSSGKAKEGLYNPNDDRGGRFGKARRGASSIGKGIINKKWLLGGAAGLGLGVIALIILFIMLASSLKIPHFIENITAYQFAKVTRQMATNSENIVAEKLAIDAADDSTWTKIKAKYTDTTGKAKDVHEKLTNRFSPAKIATNYGEAEHFKPIYVKGGLFRGQKLVGVTLDNKTYRVQSPGTFKQFIPGMKYVYDARNAKALAPYLNESLKLDGYGPLIRSKTLSIMRQELGIRLTAWKIGKYSGENPEKARLQQARDLKSAVDKEEVARGKTSALNDTTEEAKSTLDEDVKDDKKLTKILNNRGVDPEVITKVENALSSSGGLLKGLVSFLSPTYSIALPVCLIYDGSLQHNGPTMNSQSAQVRREYNYVATAAATQKDGFNAMPEAVGALNNQLGQVEKSPSEIRASGGIPNTSTYQSTQASPAGDFTVFDGLFGDGTISGVVNTIADKTCPAATNVFVGLALGTVSIATCIFSVGTSCVGEEAAKEGVKTFMGRLAEKVVTRIATEQKGQTAAAIGGVIQKGIKSTAKTGVAVVAGTILARSIVYSHSNMAHNGLQQGEDLAQDVDNGASQESSADMQRAFAGRPMTDSETAKVQQTDRLAMIEKTKSMNAFDRYASINNPSSLISRVAMTSSGYANSSIFSTIVNMGSLILKPLSGINGLFVSLFANPAYAATGNTSADTNYGNVSWGFSDSETNLLKNDPSYKMLENQKILDDNAGKEDQIAETYGSCFDGSKEIGDMLADGDIVRDDNGDVVRDKGRCSPDNLSIDSPSDLAVDTSPDTTMRKDLIFRWRVAQGYNTTLDDLINRQDISADPTAAADSSTDSIVSGDAQTLANGILTNSNISLTGRLVKEDIQAAADGKNGSAGVKMSAAILGLIATVAKDHPVGINALQSGGTGHCNNTPKSACPNNGHYNGLAVDFGSVDGKKLTGRDAGSLIIIKIAESMLPKGSGFGQSKNSDTGKACGPQHSFPSGFTEFPDSCDHLHIQVPKGTE